MEVNRRRVVLNLGWFRQRSVTWWELHGGIVLYAGKWSWLLMVQWKLGRKEMSTTLWKYLRPLNFTLQLINCMVCKLYLNKLLPKEKEEVERRGRKRKEVEEMGWWWNRIGKQKKEVCLQTQQPLKFNLSKTFLQTCPDFYPDICPYVDDSQMRKVINFLFIFLESLYNGYFYIWGYDRYFYHNKTAPIKIFKMLKRLRKGFGGWLKYH